MSCFSPLTGARMPHLQTQSDLAKASAHVIAAMSDSDGLHFSIYAYQPITKFPRLSQECLFWCDASAWIPWEPRSMLRCGKGEKVYFYFPQSEFLPLKQKLQNHCSPDHKIKSLEVCSTQKFFFSSLVGGSRRWDGICTKRAGCSVVNPSSFHGPFKPMLGSWQGW